MASNGRQRPQNRRVLRLMTVVGACIFQNLVLFPSLRTRFDPSFRVVMTLFGSPVSRRKAAQVCIQILSNYTRKRVYF